jgi:hypothetical protein
MADSRSTVRNPAILSPLNLFLLGLLGLAALVYTLLGFFTQDWLWFWPVFNQQPTQIIIHCHGQDFPLEPDSPNFLPLTNLINQQLSAEKRMGDDFISSENYRILKQDQANLSIEMRFEAQPIRIHSYHPYFSNVDSLLIVLSGDALGELTAYSAHQDQPIPGIIRVANSQKIAEYLMQHDLCLKPCKEW